MIEREPEHPGRIAEEYAAGVRFKQGLGSRGMYEQNKMNERFFIGDQWYGANCGNDRPLVRHNVIKRIGDYKISVVGSSPIAVNYSADGVPNTLDEKERVQQLRQALSSPGAPAAGETRTDVSGMPTLEARAPGGEQDAPWSESNTGADSPRRYRGANVPAAGVNVPYTTAAGTRAGNAGSYPESRRDAPTASARADYAGSAPTRMRDVLTAGVPAGPAGGATGEEINLVMSAMSDYFRVTAERVKFDDLKETVLRCAYISGTGVLYTYWDDRIRTGLYADQSRSTPIDGDIACEVLDIENVYFGDPNLDDIQAQPYILIAQRKSVAAVRREARASGASETEIQKIHADRDTGNMAGDISELEPDESCKTTLLTKFWKAWDKDGKSFRILAVKTCCGATVRKKWEMKIRRYPLAKFSWERRRNCVYGESEITYLIPNQIAINRMLTASVWAVMMMGMPVMIVNGDTVPGEITNDPGQILRVYGDQSDVASAVRYVSPPNFSPNFDNNIASLINNTLTQSGANDAALGDIRPENTSAIIAVREAATMPLQPVQNRFYSFCEDVARIWAEFWVMLYGDRQLKIEDESGTWYLPFSAERYKDLLISTKIDVGASTLWSESQSIQTLDNLFDRQVIDVVQYLTRLPKGTIPNLNGLIRDLQAANTPAGAAGTAGMAGAAGTAPAAPPDAAALLQALAGAGGSTPPAR